MARATAFRKVYDGARGQLTPVVRPARVGKSLPETDLDLKTAFSFSMTPGTAGHVRLLYWGMLLGLFLPGLNFVAGGLAWFFRAKGDDALRAHYANQFCIFWKSVIYIAVGLVLTYFLFGVLLIMAAIIWYILRIRKGLKALGAGTAPANPGSWLL